MTKAVLIHKPDSIYTDRPDRHYDFPPQYLSRLKRAVGDWVVYYEPRSARSGQGRLSYFAVAQIKDIVPHPDVPGRYLALMMPNTFIRLDRPTPRVLDGQVIEAALAGPDGTLRGGGLGQSAVRLISDAEFSQIVEYGLPRTLPEWDSQSDDAPRREFAEKHAAFERPVIERLISRPYRDAAFRLQVRRAYGHRCAMSGFGLRNGGGNPEVEAAHIVPVARGGSDDVRNGLALSHTLHWMFDRGLVTVDQDRRILVSHNKVPQDAVRRLIHPDMLLRVPEDPDLQPHPDYLAWHKEHIFGQGDAEFET